jgi:hypothetical protein
LRTESTQLASARCANAVTGSNNTTMMMAMCFMLASDTMLPG